MSGSRQPSEGPALQTSSLSALTVRARKVSDGRWSEHHGSRPLPR